MAVIFKLTRITFLCSIFMPFSAPNPEPTSSAPAPAVGSTSKPQGDDQTHLITEIIRSRLEGYDKHLRPGLLSSKPLCVKLAIHIEAITKVDETVMEFQLIIYLRQTWLDLRLTYILPFPDLEYIPLSHEFVDLIWKPDTYFPQEKEYILHEASVRNQAFKWYPNGTIFYTTRLTITSICHMDLTNFPMDYQVCSIMTESYAYDSKEIKYEWETNFEAVSFGLKSLNLLHDFHLAGHRLKDNEEKLLTGNFTLLKCEFLLHRRLGYYIISLYIPSTLIVVISAFAYYMDVSLVPERLALGITTVLTITTLALAIHANSPKISYVKATDVYSGFCFLMVFIALAHSAYISYLVTKTEKGRRAMNERHMKFVPPAAIISNIAVASSKLGDAPSSAVMHERESQAVMNPIESTTVVGPLAASKSSVMTSAGQAEIHNDPPCSSILFRLCGKSCKFARMNHMELAKKVDFVGGIAFPSTFILFNLIYWIYYLNAETVDNEEWVNDEIYN